MQYVIWVRDLLHGNLGRSYFSGRPNLSLIRGALPSTLQLTLLSLLVALALGIPFGVVAGIRSHSLWDSGLLAFTALALGIPDFLLAVVYSFLFALKLRWLPASGFINVASDPLQGLKASILPVAVLAVPLIAVFARFTRQSLAEVLGADYIRTAFAKGLPERRVVLNHALRNSLVPILTIIGVAVARLLGGVIIAESIFAWPGIGRLSVNALQQRDYSLFQSIILVFMVTVILVNMLVDIGYGLVDPRIRAS